MKRTGKVLLASGALVGLVVVGTVATSGGSDKPGHSTVTEEKVPAKKAAPKKHTGIPTSVRNGTFLVGTDLKAGTYKSAGPKDHDALSQCYWERAKDDSGKLGSIISNAIVEGPGRVTVHTGEIFKTSGDCTWKLVV